MDNRLDSRFREDPRIENEIVNGRFDLEDEEGNSLVSYFAKHSQIN